MTPLLIEARIDGQIADPYGDPVALDALLAYAIVMLEGRPPAATWDEMDRIDIPVQMSKCGRYHLASSAVYEVECIDESCRTINRRPVVAEAQALGTGIRTMQINAGPSKGYRMPLETGHLVDDTMRWWAIGDEAAVLDLLSHITHIGRRRAVGLGDVLEWHVCPCKPWGDDFPVVRDGRPLRPLPADHPGLDAPFIAMSRLTYPYWCGPREPVALPRIE